MRKNVLIGTAVAAVAALAIGAVTAGGAFALTSARTIRINARTAQHNFVDVAPPDISLGDQLIVREDLRNASGQNIGHDGVTCTVTGIQSDNDLEFECLLTAHLKDGDLTVQGFFVEPAEEDASRMGSGVLAVTGGTGVYANVGGTMDFAEVSEEEGMYTFHLLAL